MNYTLKFIKTMKFTYSDIDIVHVAQDIYDLLNPYVTELQQYELSQSPESSTTNLTPGVSGIPPGIAIIPPMDSLQKGSNFSSNATTSTVPETVGTVKTRMTLSPMTSHNSTASSTTMINRMPTDSTFTTLAETTLTNSEFEDAEYTRIRRWVDTIGRHRNKYEKLSSLDLLTKYVIQGLDGPGKPSVDLLLKAASVPAIYQALQAENDKQDVNDIDDVSLIISILNCISALLRHEQLNNGLEYFNILQLIIETMEMTCTENKDIVVLLRCGEILNILTYCTEKDKTNRMNAVKVANHGNFISDVIQKINKAAENSSSKGKVRSISQAAKSTKTAEINTNKLFIKSGLDLLSCLCFQNHEIKRLICTYGGGDCTLNLLRKFNTTQKRDVEIVHKSLNVFANFTYIPACCKQLIVDRDGWGALRGLNALIKDDMTTLSLFINVLKNLSGSKDDRVNNALIENKIFKVIFLICKKHPNDVMFQRDTLLCLNNLIIIEDNVDNLIYGYEFNMQRNDDLNSDTASINSESRGSAGQSASQATVQKHKNSNSIS